MKKETKAQMIQYRIDLLNEYRKKAGKPTVKRAWTGLSHWLATEEKDYISLGGIFVGDDKFIGFLDGLIQSYNSNERFRP